MPEASINLHEGDLLRVERLPQGDAGSALATGRFGGVRVIGSAEHLVLEEEGQPTRLIPLHLISEITLLETLAQPQVAEDDAVVAPIAPWDPAFG